MKKPLFSIFIISFFISIPYLIFSQVESDPTIFPVTNMIPPTPSNAEFDKYVNIPVSLFTGTPEISIPIWELNQGELKVPITLTYHASGVKVDEIAGWVGLGWVLNTGGIINRTIIGLPDELQDHGYFYHKSWIPESPGELYNLANYIATHDDSTTLYDAAMAGTSSPLKAGGEFTSPP